MVGNSSKGTSNIYPPGFQFGLLFKITEVKVCTCPLRLCVRHNSKDIWPRFLVCGLAMGWSSSLSKISTVRFSHSPISSFQLIYSPYPSPGTQSGHHPNVSPGAHCRPAAFSDVLALTVVLVVSRSGPGLNFSPHSWFSEECERN
jgi:hypothetical protein